MSAFLISEDNIKVWRSVLMRDVIKKALELCKTSSIYKQRDLYDVMEHDAPTYRMPQTLFSFYRTGWLFKRYFLNLYSSDYELTKCEYQQVIDSYKEQQYRKKREEVDYNNKRVMEFADWNKPIKPLDVWAPPVETANNVWQPNSGYGYGFGRPKLIKIHKKKKRSEQTFRRGKIPLKRIRKAVDDITRTNRKR